MRPHWLVQYPVPEHNSTGHAYAAHDTEEQAKADAESRVKAGAKWVTYFAVGIEEEVA